jgi:hypothetical protein
MNEGINHLTNQPTSHSVRQSVNQSINQPRQANVDAGVVEDQ